MLEEATKEQKRFPVDDQQSTTTNDNQTQGQFTKMCGLIKTMFEKISTILFDQETVSHLLSYIFDKVSNGKKKQKNIELEHLFDLLFINRTRTTDELL